MKRYKAPKLRDRRTGKSPYKRHKKVAYRYSSAYHAWLDRVLKGYSND